MIYKNNPANELFLMNAEYLTIFSCSKIFINIKFKLQKGP